MSNLATAIQEGHNRLLKVSRKDWPIHQPAAPDAPIPGRHWYSGCSYDHGHVNPATGLCTECGEPACPRCGCEPYPDGKCRCHEE